MKTQFRNFKDARKFTQSLGLKRKDDWMAYCKSGNKPNDIPAGPSSLYQKKWKGWGDFLGTGKLGPRDKRKHYLSFKDAKKFVRKLKLKNREGWRKYSKSNERPIFIPASPEKIYKKEWITMGASPGG